MRKNYHKLFFAFFTLMLFTTSLFSQNRQSIWTKILKEDISSNQLAARNAIPTKAQFYNLNLGLLQDALANAPQRGATFQDSNVIIDFPDAEGNLEAYQINEASVLATELQRNVPHLRSYVGISTEDPSTIIRFSITPYHGLNAMTLSNSKGTQYIDKYTNDTQEYAVYARRDLPVESRFFNCEFEDDGLQSDLPDLEEPSSLIT